MDSRMPEIERILFISELYSPTIGGSISVYENIYRQYPPGTIWVLTQKVPGAPAIEMRNGVPVRRVYFPSYFHSKFQMLIRYLWVLIWAWMLIFKNKIKEIHCDQVVPTGVLGWLLLKLRRVPYFVYAHGEEITIGSRFPFRKKWMLRIYQNAKGIFANSEFTRRLLLKMGIPPEKIGVIYWGVNREWLQYKGNPESLKKKYGVEGKIILLTVSRIVRRKGHAFVLKVLRDLVSDTPNLHYLIVGEGKEKNYLAELVQDFSLEDKVTFLGKLSAEELPEVYSICDLFVMPNRVLEDGEVEGFGLVFIEAGALCKPVIGGDTGGTPEAILQGKTGYLVSPTNYEELKKLVKKIVQEPELGKKLGEAAYQRVADFFVWEKVFERFIQFRKKAG